MTITLDPKTEADLRAVAERRHLSVEAYLAEIIAREVAAKSASEAPILTGEEKAREFGAWARSHRPTPLLSDDAVSRTSMYPDR